MTMKERGTVAGEIKRQIGVHGLMTVGAHKFFRLPQDRGLGFKARIHPFTKTGKRAGAPRIMTVTVVLNATDTYDVKVRYRRKVTGTPYKEGVVHYEATGIYADQLPRLMLALDYFGPETLNPRYL